MLSLTRYLYAQDEVAIALIMSMLTQSLDDALYWVNELCDSGYTNVSKLINTIYYDFYAQYNPDYENKLHAETGGGVVATIVSELCVMQSGCDVFMLRVMSESFDIEVEYDNNLSERDNVYKWLKTRDYRSFCQWLFKQPTTSCQTIYAYCLGALSPQTKTKRAALLETLDRAMSLSFVSPHVIVLSRAMHLWTKKDKKEKKEAKEKEAKEKEAKEKEKEAKKVPVYRVLSKVCRPIDKWNVLRLFNVCRRDCLPGHPHDSNWEYYASNTPIWQSRLNAHGATIDSVNKRVCFEEEPTDDNQQRFYDNWGYEPDNQPLHVKQSICPPLQQQQQQSRKWNEFLGQYNKHGVVNDVWFEEEIELLNEQIMVKYPW